MPDPSTSLDANFIWKRNDAALRAFIQTKVCSSEIHQIKSLSTAFLMIEKLKSVHEKQGAFAQMNLLLKGLTIEFSYDKPIRETLADLRSYYERIAAMGTPTLDEIFSVLLMNAMNKNFGPLQQSINSLSKSPNFSSETITSRLLDEDSLVRRRQELGQPADPYSLSSSLSPSSAFAATSRPRSPHTVCSNCKRNHPVEFCISPGGKMAGRSLDEARTAQAAYYQRLRSSRPPNQSAHIATSGKNTYL
jgi:hypothetical protein